MINWELLCLLGYYVAWRGLKPTFRDYLSLPSSKVKLSKTGRLLRKVGFIPEDRRIKFNLSGSLRSRIIGKYLDKSGRGLFGILSDHLHCENEKSQQNSKQGLPVSLPRYEPGMAQMQIRIFTVWADIKKLILNCFFR